MKTVLILSGPTHEYFDPVRYIGNASSGKMGKAIAEEALKLGANVEFISGPVPENNLPKINICKVTSAEEMLAAAREKISVADVIIFAAAVADFQPAEKLDEKLPKTKTGLTLNLKPTPDIAAELCKNKRENQITVGFALQTHDGENCAREKLIAKKLDAIVLNTPATLGAETGTFTWITSNTTEQFGLITKTACAEKIIHKIFS